MPINNALTPSGQNALGAAFGYYPQLRRNRTVQDPQSALDMPTQFLRGRVAGTLGMPSDILNMLRSPMPMEMAGETDYAAQQQLPYGSQELLKTLPLPPQGAAQQAAANVGAVIPMTPMEALQAARLARQAALAGGKGVKAVGRMAGEELNAAMFGERQGTLLGAVTPQPKFMFVGENSKTWNAGNAAKAVELEKAGAAPEDIWAATGTFRGPEGKLRQEISDANSMPGHKLYSWGEATDLERGNSTVVRRQKALLHPELSAAYPDTKNIGVFLKPGRKGGYYETERDNIGVPISENGSVNRSTMLHELQHAVQQREGFAGGGDPQTMILTLEEIAKQKRQQAQEMFSMSSANDPLDPTRLVKPGARKKGLQLEKEARELDEKALLAYHSEQAKFDMYQRLAGEAEARAVQSRMNMSPQERMATFPYQSYDVPLNQLIVRTK